MYFFGACVLENIFRQRWILSGIFVSVRVVQSLSTFPLASDDTPCCSVSRKINLFVSRATKCNGLFTVSKKLCLFYVQKYFYTRYLKIFCLSELRLCMMCISWIQFSAAGVYSIRIFCSGCLLIVGCHTYQGAGIQCAVTERLACLNLTVISLHSSIKKYDE
jgi:hypothetical protein